MPFYEVSHALAMTDAQKDELAQAITRIHTSRFTTPSMFVNVRFVDARNEYYYVGGKRRATSRISAIVRAGGGRTNESFGELALELQAAWNKVLLGNDSGDRIPRGDERELQGVFVTGSILAGVESGFAVPQAGGDVEWMRTNIAEFQRLADEGHEDFIDLMSEVRSKKELQSVIE